MNILVIDYLSYPEHRNFNNIHLNALIKEGHKLCLVGRSKQFIEFDQNNAVQIVELPKIKLFFKSCSRFNNIFALLWVKKKLHLSDFDLILFTTYDILSLCFFRTRILTLLINHNNVSMYDDDVYGIIKFWLTRYLPDKYYHICLNKEMEWHMKELLPEKKIFYVPHGICSLTMKLEKPSFISNDESFLVLPINRNYDSKFISELLNSSLLHDYLTQKNIILYIKKQMPYNGTCDKIICIDNNLGKSQYEYLISNAKAVILPYGSRFKYRCSGILFECIGFNTPIIATDINALKIFENSCDIHFFKDVLSLIGCLNMIDISVPIKYNIEKFNPTTYWRILFKNLQLD